MISKELVAASSRPLVLYILAQGESYGYDIIQRVRALSDGQLEWRDGMLYPVLHRLEGEGLVQAQWKVSAAGRKRKYYRLTAQGHGVLQTERQQWMAVHTTLAKLWGAHLCLT